MSKNNRNGNVTVNGSVDKEEKEMTTRIDDELDLRDDAQKEAEDAELAEKQDENEEQGFFAKHKKPFIIGGVVVGVLVVGGFGLWGVHNRGLGKTFFGGKKVYKGHGHRHHGHAGATP